MGNYGENTLTNNITFREKRSPLPKAAAKQAPSRQIGSYDLLLDH